MEMNVYKRENIVVNFILSLFSSVFHMTADSKSCRCEVSVARLTVFVTGWEII